MMILAVALLIYIINIPFGYWRSNVKKFTIEWFLSIHIPVPFVILLRLYTDVGFAWYTYPIFIGAFFLGQYTGKKIYASLEQLKSEQLSSILFLDLLKK